MISYVIFETAIGFAALAWRDQGFVGVRLPQASAEVSRASLMKRFADAAEAEPSPVAGRAIAGIRAVLRGEADDLRDVTIDITRVAELDARVYEIARMIPLGRTLTYGEIAARLGDKLLARDVGAALGRNPWPIVVPCHRVIAAGGKLGGFSAPGGAATKQKLLEIEGAAAIAPPCPRAPSQPSLFG